MGDLNTTEARSAIMKRVGREDTAPEKDVRSLLWSTGARYRTHVSGLPGTPDIANKSRRKAIFVHGCFWHFHGECEKGVLPERNRDFWEMKFQRNKQRDRRKVEALKAEGFEVLTVWECELDDPTELRKRLLEFWFEETSG